MLASDASYTSIQEATGCSRATVAKIAIKAGLVIVGSAGSGTLTFQGRRYSIGIGGISYGFTFGASDTRFHGTVSNIRQPQTSQGSMPRGMLARPSFGARRRSYLPTRTVQC
jgi:hypothetical protein